MVNYAPNVKSVTKLEPRLGKLKIGRSSQKKLECGEIKIGYMLEKFNERVLEDVRN